jgi:glutamine synthetase
VIAMLDKYKVLSPRELNSRYEVYLEQYILSVHVEAVETARVGKTAILPAALRYQALLADNVAKLTAVDVPADRTMLDAVTAEITKLTTGIAALETALAHEAGDSSSLEHALQAKNELIPPMADVRAAADALEELVADDLWPLPTYQEMLHIL